MKLGPVTKLDKRNKTKSKKFDDDAVSANCDTIVIFLVYGQFGAIRIPDVYFVKLKFSLIVNFYVTKTERKT